MRGLRLRRGTAARRHLNSPLGLLTFPKVALAFIVGYFGRSYFKANILMVSVLLLPPRS
jgi:hypothetical protein